MRGRTGTWAPAETQEIGDRGRATLRIPASRVITHHPVAIIHHWGSITKPVGDASRSPTPAASGAARAVGTLVFAQASWAHRKSDAAPPRLVHIGAMPPALGGRGARGSRSRLLLGSATAHVLLAPLFDG